MSKVGIDVPCVKTPSEKDLDGARALSRILRIRIADRRRIETFPDQSERVCGRNDPHRSDGSERRNGLRRDQSMKS